MYAFPAFLNLTMLTIFIFVIKQDSIMYSLSSDQDEEALKLIKKVYASTEDHAAVLAQLKL